MSDSILAVFYRKPISLAEIKSTRVGFDGGTCEVRIIERKVMTASEYDDFADNFLLGRPWLEGKGGHSIKRNGDHAAEIHHAIEVTAPDRETLYVNPSGHSYARYVGIVVNASQKEV